MGKRYYCDFCDKSFANNDASKNNHFKGSHHLFMKKAHYDSFRDPESVLFAELGKDPCRKFLTTGQCDYGSDCRFSHLTAEDKRRLQEEYHKNVLRKQQELERNDLSIVGQLDEWLSKRAEMLRKSDNQSDGCGRRKQRKTLPHYTVPSVFASMSDLPPSMLPPTADDFTKLPLLEWGV